MSDEAPDGMCLILENDRLRIWDVHGKAANMHYDHPTVRWAVVPLPATGGEGETDISSPDPEFYAAGEAVRVPNFEPDGPEPWREIIFEILQHKPMHTKAEIESLLAAPTYPTAVGGTMVFKNELCRLWDFQIPPSRSLQKDVHQHVFPYAFMFLDGGRLDVFKPARGNSLEDNSMVSDVKSDDDGAGERLEFVCALERKEGGVVWSDIAHGGFQADGRMPNVPKAIHSVNNTRTDSRFHEYLIELK